MIKLKGKYQCFSFVCLFLPTRLKTTLNSNKPFNKVTNGFAPGPVNQDEDPGCCLLDNEYVGGSWYNETHSPLPITQQKQLPHFSSEDPIVASDFF